MMESFRALVPSACRPREAEAFIATDPQTTERLFSISSVLPSIFGGLMLAVLTLVPIAQIQAAAVATILTSGGLNMDMFGHAQAGNRQATAVAYVNCIEGQHGCGGSVSSIAGSTYDWNIFAAPGFEGISIPLIVDYTLAAGFLGQAGSARARIEVLGINASRHQMSLTLGVLSGQFEIPVMVSHGQQFTTLQIHLRADAFAGVSHNNFPTSKDYRFAWAYADPTVMIDPTWEFASNFTLIEMVNDLLFEGLGDIPPIADLDLRDIPTELVGIAVVPIPTAVWLFGSALGLLGWMRKRKAAA